MHVLWPAEGWNNPAAHSEQALAKDIAENVPTGHLLQELAPGSLPVLVLEPAVHVSHELLPVEGWNSPAAQSVQVVAAETAVDFPVGHSVQVLPPGSLPVLVIDPAAQTVHAATLDTAEYWPAVHAVQLTAADAIPVSVMDPGWHTTQCDQLRAA